MDQLMVLQKEKCLNAGFEVSKRLAHAGYNMEAPAFFITWGQIAEEVSHILVDQNIHPDLVSDAELCELVEGVKDALNRDFVMHWREFARTQLFSQDTNFPDDQEPDEGALVEQFENATRLGDEEGYWVDGGASADFFDDC
jgi:hypothetical protein